MNSAVESDGLSFAMAGAAPPSGDATTAPAGSGASDGARSASPITPLNRDLLRANRFIICMLSALARRELVEDAVEELVRIGGQRVHQRQQSPDDDHRDQTDEVRRDRSSEGEV